jgi:hypothetical protein
MGKVEREEERGRRVRWRTCRRFEGSMMTRRAGLRGLTRFVACTSDSSIAASRKGKRRSQNESQNACNVQCPFHVGFCCGKYITTHFSLVNTSLYVSYIILYILHIVYWSPQHSLARSITNTTITMQSTPAVSQSLILPFHRHPHPQHMSISPRPHSSSTWDVSYCTVLTVLYVLVNSCALQHRKEPLQSMLHCLAHVSAHA